MQCSKSRSVSNLSTPTTNIQHKIKDVRKFCHMTKENDFSSKLFPSFNLLFYFLPSLKHSLHESYFSPSQKLDQFRILKTIFLVTNKVIWRTIWSYEPRTIRQHKPGTRRNSQSQTFDQTTSASTLSHFRTYPPPWKQIISFSICSEKVAIDLHPQVMNYKITIMDYNGAITR